MQTNWAALIPGVLLGIAALIIIGWYFWSLLPAALGLPLLERLEQRSVIRKRASLAMARVLMEKGAYAQSHPLLREAFLLTHVRSCEAMVDRVLEHHLAVLSTILAFAERYPVPLANLPIIEELVQSRAALSKAYLEAVTTTAKLRQRQRTKAKASSPPAWALSEFVKKVKELKSKIKMNRKSLHSEIGKLFALMGHAAEQSGVTYH